MDDHHSNQRTRRKTGGGDYDDVVVVDDDDREKRKKPDDPLPSSSASHLPPPPPQKSPKKSSFSPKRLKKTLLSSGGLSGSNAEIQSSPCSPNLGGGGGTSSRHGGGRLGRVSRLISRSDANLAKKRTRHDSGDSSAGYESGRATPDEGSPSRGLMARAAGYVTHLKSRLNRHRSRGRENTEQQEGRGPSATTGSSEKPYHHSSQPLSCCGSRRYIQDDSFDTLSGVAADGGQTTTAPSSSVPSIDRSSTGQQQQHHHHQQQRPSSAPAPPGSETTTTGELSVNVSFSTTTNESHTIEFLGNPNHFNPNNSFLDHNYYYSSYSNNPDHDSSSSHEKAAVDSSQSKSKSNSKDPTRPSVESSSTTAAAAAAAAAPTSSTSAQVNGDSSGGGNTMSGNNVAAAAAAAAAAATNAAFPFHTLNVHLLRGKNLVSKDANGLSDPYVKVKIGDKLHFKSKTIYRDLNPVWDESFVLPINDLVQPIVFKVFDYDWGFQDDFMGMTCLSASRLPPNKMTELSLTLTEQGAVGNEPMGEIYITVTLVPRTIEEKDIWFSEAQSSKKGDDKKLKSQVWSSVLTVLLLEAKNLSPGDEKVYMDAYVKFRMGNQKYKTRTLARTTYPKWVEQFDFYIYDGQPQILEVQVFDESFSKDYIARCAIDIGLLEKETTHNKTFALQESPGEISMLLTISGTSGGDNPSDLANHLVTDEELYAARSKYSLTRSLNNIKDVGHLTVKVFEAQGLSAADIGGKSDPFCVLELVNMRVQTQTEYKTLNPVWNKVFQFEVLDVTSVLEVTVYDEDKNHKQEFLGRLDIPVWKIKNKEKKWYMLKDKMLSHQAKGNNPQILLELDLSWNPVRAGIRVMDPPESKFLLADQKLKRETFLLNIDRLRKIAAGIYDVAQFVESCLVWEYPLRSVIALVSYEIICYSMEIWMVPMFLMLLILKQWIVCSLMGTPLLDEPDDEEVMVMEDDDDEKEDDDKKMSLRQKLQAVQDATQTVQNALGDIASICESTRNMFRMAVPFISWIAVFGLLVATILLYFIPLRYLAMAWGFHKFFRPLLRPNVVPTNEVYNLLLRVPDNPQMVQYRPLRVVSPSENIRNRTPPAGGGSGGGGSSATTHHHSSHGHGRQASGDAGSSSGKTPQTKKKYKFW